MRRFSLSLVVTAVALTFAHGALADGPPIPVSQGGTGVANHAQPGLHYVTVPAGARGTILETVDQRHGSVLGWWHLNGLWGIPTVSWVGQGLSADGRTLVLAAPESPYASPSHFLVMKTRTMKVLRRITLRGPFSFDAISPDGSRLYFIQYTHAGDLTHYVVRAYDLRANRLLPGRVADRSEHETTMSGYPVSRATSGDGRWDYTLYAKPTGGAFVHALDTVRAVAHCIALPANSRIYSVSLSLLAGGRTLAADLPHGRRWLNVSVGSWRVSRPAPATARAGSPWAWIGAGIGGALALLAAGALLLRRRRGQRVEKQARQELGLA
jgi:hypothetical protein